MERAQLSPGAWRTPLATTRLAGTIAYMPPQAFTGARPSAHFDLWALAVVLFEAVVGRHPFADGPATEDNIRRGRFVAQFDDTAVPPDVRAFLRRTLKVGAAPVFDSAAAMRDALAASLSALPATERSSHAH
jgi:serine/threonine protein kinase